jgi:hypothetical protein
MLKINNLLARIMDEIDYFIKMSLLLLVPVLFDRRQGFNSKKMHEVDYFTACPNGYIAVSSVINRYFIWQQYLNMLKYSYLW